MKSMKVRWRTDEAKLGAFLLDCEVVEGSVILEVGGVEVLLRHMMHPAPQQQQQIL
jgi:hypothetical protein